jgi:hypothetical protein
MNMALNKLRDFIAELKERQSFSIDGRKLLKHFPFSSRRQDGTAESTSTSLILTGGRQWPYVSSA